MSTTLRRGMQWRSSHYNGFVYDVRDDDTVIVKAWMYVKVTPDNDPTQLQNVSTVGFFAPEDLEIVRWDDPGYVSDDYVRFLIKWLDMYNKVKDERQFYLFAQGNTVHSPSAGYTDEYNSYFVSHCSSREEYIESIHRAFHKLVADPEETYYTDDDQFDEYVINEGYYTAYDEGAEAYDGEARVVQHYDNVVCLGPVTIQEMNVLAKFGIKIWEHEYSTHF